MKARHFHYITLLTFLLIIAIFGFGVSNVNSIMELIYTKSEICNKDFLPRIGTFGDSVGLLNALFVTRIWWCYPDHHLAGVGKQQAEKGRA